MIIYRSSLEGKRYEIKQKSFKKCLTNFKSNDKIKQLLLIRATTKNLDN